MSIIIKQLASEDIDEFVQLICVFEDVFEMKDFKMPDVAYLQTLLKKEDFFVFVALSGEEVVGGLTSYIMSQYYSTAPLVYIFDLAVKTDFQRKGIGRMLIEANNHYSESINAEAVMVQADIVDEHAIEFYRSTGAKGEKVIHFDYPLNKNQ